MGQVSFVAPQPHVCSGCNHFQFQAPHSPGHQRQWFTGDPRCPDGSEVAQNSLGQKQRSRDQFVAKELRCPNGPVAGAEPERQPDGRVARNGA